MSDEIHKSSDSIQDRLADLGEQFNTNKSFGLMGMLESQQEQQQAQATVTAADPGDDDDKDKTPPEWLEPIHSSVRSIAETTSREIGAIRSELASFRQPQVQQAQDMGSQDPYEQKINALGQQLEQTKLNTAWERAKNALNAARSKYGADFDYKEDELVNTWKQHIGTNVRAAEATDWDVYFKQQHDSRRVPKLEQRLKEMEAESRKTGRDVMSGLGALPRGNRNGAPQAAPGAGSDFDEDIYRKASARMGKGQFKGFNRLLVEEQNKKLLRTAV